MDGVQDFAFKPAEREQRLIVLRVLFGALALSALVLGYLGLNIYVPPTGDLDAIHYQLDLVYADLQLFVLSSGPLQGGPYPWQLEFARFVAPLTTAYTLGAAAWHAFGDAWSARRRRRAKRHAIVTGDTAAAEAIAEALLRDGQRVLRVAEGQLGALRDAGIAGATALYACEDDGADSAVNVATALSAARIRTKMPLKVYAQVSDPDLALALRARRLGLPQPQSLKLDFFNVEDLAARILIGREAGTGSPPHIVVAGVGAFGRAIVMEHAKHWRLRPRGNGERLAVTLVDPQATAAAAHILARWPMVGDYCQLAAIDGDIADALRSAPDLRRSRIYLCYENEELALSTALTVAGLWFGDPGSLVVRLSRLSGHVSAFKQTLLEDLGGRLKLVGVTELACDPVEIHRDQIERFAEAIHDNYLMEQLSDGLSMGANRSMVAWQDMSETSRDANRAQAQDISTKLLMLGMTLAPRSSHTPAFAFQGDEVEQLAIYEHSRWCDERAANGWRYGRVRDDAKKIHPSLVPWEKLSESERDKDRDAVANLPLVLSDAGLQMVRLEPRPDGVQTGPE